MPGFRVGIEVELLLTLRRQPSREIKELKALASGFAKRYNEEARENHPLMHNDVEESYEGDNINDEWTLIDDSTIRTNPGAESQCKAGQDCFDLIDQSKNHVDVMDLMNNGSDRTFAWNFTNLQYSQKCTVEWRRGPGVHDGETYLDWVELVIAFAGSAMTFGTVDRLKDYSQDVKGLKEFIKGGLVEKMNEPERLERIFGDIYGAVEPIPIGNLSASEREQVEKKAKEEEKKNIMVKKVLKAADEK